MSVTQAEGVGVPLFSPEADGSFGQRVPDRGCLCSRRAAGMKAVEWGGGREGGEERKVVQTQKSSGIWTAL